MRWGLDDAAGPADATTVLQRIRAEFREMPGLKLTPAQATRLWHLDPRHSEEFLNALVGDGLLRRSADGAYLVSSDPVRTRGGHS
jgi:hypothetical protein